MTKLKSHTLALCLVALAVFGLFLWALQLLTVPKIFLLVQRPYPLFQYQGPVLMSLAIALAWFREWASEKLVWLCLEMHRLISSLLMAAVIGSEGLMHMFNISHVEGWWIPLLSGGTAITFGAWFQKMAQRAAQSGGKDAAMTDTPTPPPPSSTLPDAQTYLQGKDGVKSLQHDAESLRRFADGFEEVPLAPKATERVVQLGDVMRQKEWPDAHNAAHKALGTARKLVTENPTPELAAEAHSVEAIFKSHAPNAGTLKMVKHPELQETFKPLGEYLEKFGGFVTGWMGIAPARMKPGEESITPAAHRAAALLKSTETPHIHGPDCKHDHTPTDPKRPSLTVLPETPHEHGPGCGHDHHPPPPVTPSVETHAAEHNCGTGCDHGHTSATSSSSGSDIHYHGDTPCTHNHPSAPGSCGHSHEPHTPKGMKNGALWATAAIGAVCVGAYLINEYGKPDKKKPAPTKPGDWRERAQTPSQQEARTL